MENWEIIKWVLGAFGAVIAWLVINNLQQDKKLVSIENTEEYTDSEFRSVREAVSKVADTSSMAISKVESNYKSDKASANEFRGQLKDQAATFVTRRELWSAVVTIIAIMMGLLSYFK